MRKPRRIPRARRFACRSGRKLAWSSRSRTWTERSSDCGVCRTPPSSALMWRHLRRATWCISTALFEPPGIDGSSAGPFLNLYAMDLANPCTQGFQSGAANSNKSGIVFFPGSAGLFRNGALVGGLGVSGDGVDQDDYVTNGGTKGFEAPTNARADQILDQGVRLPYFKFPRNPTN